MAWCNLGMPVMDNCPDTSFHPVTDNGIAHFTGGNDAITVVRQGIRRNGQDQIPIGPGSAFCPNALKVCITPQAQLSLHEPGESACASYSN
jgi:hypothetical protein